MATPGPQRREDKKYAKQRPRKIASILGIATFLETLANHKPGRGFTRNQLKEITGLHPTTVATYLNQLEGRLVYVIHWDKKDKSVTAEWAFGIKEANVLKPKPLTAAEISRRQRAVARKKKEQEEEEKLKATPEYQEKLKQRTKDKERSWKEKNPGAEMLTKLW